MSRRPHHEKQHRAAMRSAFTFAAVVAAGVIVAWACVLALTAAGPNCPAPADPQWIGWCSEAPSKP